MQKNIYNVILSFSILIICCSCNEGCDDCLELTTKSVKYIDSSGANLLFGDEAIFNPNDLVITAERDIPVSVWKQDDTGTIAFNLDENYKEYILILSDSLIDTLEFELADRKSTSCCGNLIFSTKTILNGEEIENEDLILITH